MEQSWPGIIPECDVYHHKKTRYHATNDHVDYKTSTFSRELNVKTENIDSAQQGINDVIQGVEVFNKQSRKPKGKITHGSSLFLPKRKKDGRIVSNVKLDSGFAWNFYLRKDSIVRGKTEGCVTNCVNGMETMRDKNPPDEPVQMEVKNCSKEVMLKKQSNRIEIRIVNFLSNTDKNCGTVKEESLDSSAANETEEIAMKSDRPVKCERFTAIDSAGLSLRKKESGVTKKREQDLDLRPSITMETPGIGISIQIKDDSNSIYRLRRQHVINSVNSQNKETVKVISKCSTDTVKKGTERGKIADSRNHNERQQNCEAIQMTTGSLDNGVEPIGNYGAVNSPDQVFVISRRDDHRNDGCSNKDGWESPIIEHDKNSGNDKLDETNEKLEMVNDEAISVKRCSYFSNDLSNCKDVAMKEERRQRAVIESTISNTANLKGSSIEKQDHKIGRTKLFTEPKIDSIVDISKAGYVKEDVGGLTRKNKLIVAIVDDETEYENNGLNFSFDSAGCESEGRQRTQTTDCDCFRGVCLEQGQDFVEDKRTKTINSLGYHNPVLENKRPARKSIVCRPSQKCIVNGAFQGVARKELKSSTFKMWRNSTKADATRGAETADEKKKVIYQGQGVQFRLNVNKSEEGKEGEAKEEKEKQDAIARKAKRVISTAKSVAVKSVLTEKTKTEIDVNEEELSGKGGKIAGKGKERAFDDDLTYFDEELTQILNYEPPELIIPVKTGKGHVKFDLKKPAAKSGISLEMENARLSKVLLEVERARATTVKALLSANAVLHKIHNENVQLEGSLKTLGSDKKFLEIELDECKEKLKSSEREKDIFNVSKATEFESSMGVIVNSWRKEKQEMLAALTKSSMRVKRVEADAEGLRAGFQRVKNQLENSNETFTKLLEHNLQASVKVEEELCELKTERVVLLEKTEKQNAESMKMQHFQKEIDELKQSLDACNDEKEELCSKISQLEKKNKQSRLECEDLHEQVDHYQEIVDKLAEKEEDLTDLLKRETSEREYLQGCLDETGQILLHLRNNEKKLLDEKDELVEDLEEEIQVNESLQQSLKTTMQEHQSLVNRLQDMTKVHITVKESLDEACKKEKSYQQQIANLSRTNSILHYNLEKEKDERIDLQEMYDNLDSQWKLFKHERLLESIDLKKNMEDLAETEAQARLQNEQFVNENKDLRESLEQEEEENEDMRKKLARLEQWKATKETDLEMLQQLREANQSEICDLKKRVEDLNRGLKKEKDQYENLMCTLEDTEESLDKVSRSLSEARDTCAGHLKANVELNADLVKKEKDIRELEIKLGEEKGEKEGLYNRIKSLENELTKTKKNIVEQREELETNQMHFRRLEKEKLCLRKSLEESKQEFDIHKERCVDNFQKLREELVGVQNKLVEKDRQSMKEKENWQDAIENTAADLKLLREIFSDDMKYKALKQGAASLREVLEKESGNGKDIDILKKAYHRAESELLGDNTDLEGMRTVAVVQSPMSKIKLSEIKALRDEIHELTNNIVNARRRISDIFEEIIILKKGEERGEIDNRSLQSKTEEIELKLTNLDEIITKVLVDHQYAIEKSTNVIRNGMAKVEKDSMLEEVESAGESGYEIEARDVLGRHTEPLPENKRLKVNIEFIKKQSGVAKNTSEEKFEYGSNNRANELNKTAARDGRSEKLIGAADVPKYVPPTSMRYPPRYGGGSQSVNGYHTGFQLDERSNHDKAVCDKTGISNKEKSKKSSFFAAEMSLFHHDESVAANILRRKLEGKATLRGCKSDTASVRSSDSLRGSELGRFKRSGSVDGDDENDDDSDVPVGELRRSKTLPRKHKSRNIWANMV